MVLKTLRAALLVASLVVALGGPKGGVHGGSAQAPTAQQPGAIRGRVEIARVLSSPRPAPGSGDDLDLGGASMPSDLYRRAVVFLDPPPEHLERPSDVHVRMNQKNERFIPHLLAIPVGSVVDFPNEDRTYHNVFSLSKTKRFDLGRYAAGQSKAVRFDQPGIVRVFCEIHSHMNAFILVFDHRFFAVTDDAGRFRLERVPPGTYRLTAWYEGVAQQTQTVTVPPGMSADVEFALK